MASGFSITVDGISNASTVIAPEFLDTPLLDAVRFDWVDAPDVTLKDETATPIRCFKGRGTDYFADKRAAAHPKVVCASAGNFGQGLAMAMARRGGKAVVFAATNANALKVERMRDLGGEVILRGGDFDEANAAARAYAEERRLPFIEDAALGEIAEGAGTIAKELTEAGAEIDAIYVPVGGGALINGIGTWLRHARPDVLVIGVCAEGAPALALSWQNRKAVATRQVDTIADGIAIGAPVTAARQHMLGVVHDFVLVSDAEILGAMRAIRRATGIAAEPAGAAGVAAAFKDARSRGVDRSASVLCGANVPAEKMADWFGDA